MSIRWNHIIEQVWAFRDYLEAHSFSKGTAEFMEDFISDITSCFPCLIESESTQLLWATRTSKAGEDYRFFTDWLIDTFTLQKAIKNFNKITQDYHKFWSNSMLTYIKTEKVLNISHTSHWLSIYLFSSSSVTSKAIWHSDTDLWDTHRKITEFNEVINLIT